MAFPDRFGAFVFDLDGTLVTIPVDWEGVRRGLRALSGGEPDFRGVFAGLRALLASRPELTAEAFSLIDGYEMAAVPSSSALEGSRELLEHLSRRAKLALVTMQGRRACQALLDRLGLDGFFKGVVAREDSLDRSEQVALALRRLGVPPSDTVLVGDMLNDVLSARKAGVKVVLLGKKPLDQVKPDFNFESPLSFLSDVTG